MGRQLKTTRPISEVHTIKDIIAIESQPYDELVTAHNLYDLFLATAEHVGDSKALTVLRSEDPQDVGASWTHRELLTEVTRAANMFQTLGLAQGKGVAAFLAPTLPALPPLLLGAQVAGVASALNYLLSPEAIFDLLNAQKATILVIPSRKLDEMCWSKAVDVFKHVPTLLQVVVIGDDTEDLPGFLALTKLIACANAETLDFKPSTNRDTVCALFHTGGTTGSPKLVQLTHGNQIHAAFSFAQVFGYNENDVVINGFPFFHVGGTMTVGLSVIAAGGHIVVPSPYGLRPPSVIERYWEIVQHFKVTVVGGVPTSIGSITNSWVEGTDVSSVRMAVTGGAILPKAVGSRFEETTGIRLYETYGMTETAAAIAFNPGCGEPLAGSVGFRAPYSETRIVSLDTEELNLCKPNESGAVQIRGPQVFPGYVDTAHNEGTLGEDGWLTTGDVGYLTDDARLVLTGREKDLIVRSGHNIDPAAIEDVANQFENVDISAAVGMPDQYAGEMPALFVVPEPGTQIDIDALKTYLGANLHEAPARPKSITVIDALPVTAVGKIFKPALREMAIKEKVRLEVLAICGPEASAKVTVGFDARRNIVVDVLVNGAEPDTLAKLETELKPLPQTYNIQPSQAVTLTIDNNIATLTLNRPAALNALSNDAMSCLKEHLKILAELPGLRVVVITGSGRAFSAGGDLTEFEEALLTDKKTLLDYLRYNQEILQQVEDLPVPVIAAVNGFAVAGGLELLLCCDILIAAEHAKIGDGHTRYGIVPAGGATVRLMEKISPSHAAQLFYTAELVNAETFRDWGLVNEVVASDQLMDRAMEIATEISKRSPEAIRHTKALIKPNARSVDRGSRIEAELERFAEHVDGSDLATGLKAFRLKQEPKY